MKLNDRCMTWYMVYDTMHDTWYDIIHDKTFATIHCTIHCTIHYVIYDMVMIWYNTWCMMYTECDMWYDEWQHVFMIQYMICDTDMVLWYNIWCDIWYDIWYNIWYGTWYETCYGKIASVIHDIIWYDAFDFWCEIIWYDMLWYNLIYDNVIDHYIQILQYHTIWIEIVHSTTSYKYRHQHHQPLSAGTRQPSKLKNCRVNWKHNRLCPWDEQKVGEIWRDLGRLDLFKMEVVTGCFFFFLKLGNRNTMMLAAEDLWYVVGWVYEQTQKISAHHFVEEHRGTNHSAQIIARTNEATRWVSQI